MSLADVDERCITRRGRVENRDIVVYDDLLPDSVVSALANALDSNAFTHMEVARPETTQFRHWASNLSLQDAQRLPLFAPSLAAASPFEADGYEYRVTRAYCNYAQHGDMLFTHVDCPPDARGLTALWFIAKEWHVDWGGETLFFNNAGDAEFVVSPRPGRLVVFDGAILHVGRPPNRICFAPRYSFAFKLEAHATPA